MVPPAVAGAASSAIAEVAPSAVAGQASSAVAQAASSTDLLDVVSLADRIVSVTSWERIGVNHGSGGGIRDGSVDTTSLFEKTDEVPSHVGPDEYEWYRTRWKGE